MQTVFSPTLFDALPPAAIIDRDGFILRANQAWRDFGVENGMAKNAESVGINYLTICNSATGADAAEASDAGSGIRAVINGDLDEFNLEYPCHSATEYRWFNMRVSRFYENDELRILIMHQNITRWKLVEAQLQEAHDELERRVEERTAELSAANEEVRHFAYIVSHDLRAPLVNVQGFVSELKGSLAIIEKAMRKWLPELAENERQEILFALEEDIPEAFDFIKSAVSRMDHYIAAILQLSRLGRRELHLETIDLNDLVDEVLKSFAHQIVEKQVMIALGGLPSIVADRTAMQQILGNIINNAIQYLDPNRPGEIEICGEVEDDGSVAVSIRDNGRGIAEEDAHKVFQPFRRAGKQDVPGEGMGLAYVQALIRRHGGHIGFRSTGDNGVSFSFTIPKLSISTHSKEGDS